MIGWPGFNLSLDLGFLSLLSSFLFLYSIWFLNAYFKAYSALFRLNLKSKIDFRDVQGFFSVKPKLKRTSDKHILMNWSMVCQLSKQGTLLLYLIKIRIESLCISERKFTPSNTPSYYSCSDIELRRGTLTYKLSWDVLAFWDSFLSNCVYYL